MQNADIEIITVTNAKELDTMFTKMITLFKDKETEHNWETRHKDIIRLRGLIRGNGPEKFLDIIVNGIRLMVDGITKSTESLRTTLVLDALHLVADIGTYLPRSLDAYMYDQFLNSLIRATSVAKRIVAFQAKDSMIEFLLHANYYPKTPHLFWLAMNEKNNQVRHFVVLYVKAMLQAHASKEQVRHSMDRSGGTDLIGKIMEKGLVDAAPIVRETCREPFWFFWHFWQDRGDALLRQLSPSIRKPLEKSKSSALAALTAPSSTIHSPSQSINSMNHQHHSVSPSSSNTSTGSLESSLPAKSRHISSNYQINNSNVTSGLQKRSMSPSLRSTSPLVFRHPTTTTPISSTALPHPSSNHLGHSPATTTTTTTTTQLRKSRVPGLSRKKSMLSVKRNQSILTLLQQDDLALRVEGLQALARKLTPYTDYPVELATIQVDVGGGANAYMVDGATFQSVILTLLASSSTNVKLYEALSTWDSVLGIMLKLVPFDDYLPKIMLDCAVEQQQQPQQSVLLAQKKDDDWIRYTSASRAWARSKWYLKRHDPDLADKIYNGLAALDGSQHYSHHSTTMIRKKQTLRPLERRKLTRQWLVWMDELVLSVIGLDNEDEDGNSGDNPWLSEENEDPVLIRHGLGKAYWQRQRDQEQQSNENNTNIGDTNEINHHHHLNSNNDSKNVASSWFESDANVRQCLHLLLPLLSTSAPGSLWHDPLVTLVGHLRLVNQKLFDMLVGTLDEAAASKISRVLGIHLRVVFTPPTATVLSPPRTSDINDDGVMNVDEMEGPTLDNKDVDDDKDSNEQSFLSQVEKSTLEREEVSLINQPAPKELEHKTEEQNGNNEIIDDGTVLPTVSSSSSSSLLQQDVPKAEHMNEEPISNRQESTACTTLLATSLIGEADGTLTPSTSPPPPATTNTISTSTVTEFNDNNDNDNDSLTALRIPSPIPTSIPLASTQAKEAEAKQEASASDDYDHVPSFDTPVTPDPTTTSLPNEGQEDQSKKGGENDSNDSMPTHVPYFAPSVISNDVLPVFDNNHRSEGNAKDKSALLYQLIDKLKQHLESTGNDTAQSQHHQHIAIFRKLMRLSKESPIQKKWDQGGNSEQGADVWASAQKDGGNFVELMQVVLRILTSPSFQCCTLFVLDLIRQLAMAQTGLMRFYEMKFDRHGMTLEARLVEQLLEKRADPDPTICTAAEDSIEAVLVDLEPQTVFDIFLAYLTHRLMILKPPIEEEKDDNEKKKERYDPIGSAYTFLGQSVSQVNNTMFVEEWLTRGGVAVFIKGLNDSQIQVRKSCVYAIVEFQEILGDDLYLFLGDLREDQLNLVKHYVNKSLKKKASLRQLCANGQLR
ncbi:clasp N terminal-domain-containing protein [Halteromyces radiatus]|uniref:clasp N terminal-domain-containing protein n=1 Tax=Halteromyces radiatus TaxID=101107 RepID=UPI00221E9CB3|nr:clasp N terminal-domain-containing protein [Halteromyces radiatus]KAI8096355.1 clasp N terminal-domain-containing protein [Halteromyces radiatus]